MMLVLKRTVVDCCFCFRKICTFVSSKMHHTFYLFLVIYLYLARYVTSCTELFVMTEMVAWCTSIMK